VSNPLRSYATSFEYKHCDVSLIIRAVSWTIRVGLAYLNKSTPPYTLLVFFEGVIVNITPPWIRAPIGKRPYDYQKSLPINNTLVQPQLLCYKLTFVFLHFTTVSNHYSTVRKCASLFEMLLETLFCYSVRTTARLPNHDKDSHFCPPN
jgi:hypothetical protein